MLIKEFINRIENARLLGKVYRLDELKKEEELFAKENGLVVVFGYSDDCAEFRGAISDEIGCYDGGRVFEKNGYYIDAVWCKYDIPWTYETNIPHESFSVWDDEDNSLYCQAIVFDIKQLSKGAKE